MVESINNIPKRVFIVPYRNRKQQKFFFSKYMSYLLEDIDDYEIYFSHQYDKRSFNRGASKNIGFLAIKQKYPNDYKNISFIFNDVDTMPFNKIFNYDTTLGVIKHYYGFKFALGGIVVIKGDDFEKINGFPNYWGYGMEDNCLQKRADIHKLITDRTQFYPIGSAEILQLFDGISRIISKKDPWRMQHDNGIDGLRTIHKLFYSINERSLNDDDNEFIVDNPKIYIINISHFLTCVAYENEEYSKYDLRDPPRKIIHPNKIVKIGHIADNIDDWTNIPQYHAQQEKMGLSILKNTYQQQHQQQHQQHQQHQQQQQQQQQQQFVNNNVINQNTRLNFKLGLGGLK